MGLGSLMEIMPEVAARYEEGERTTLGKENARALYCHSGLERHGRHSLRNELAATIDIFPTIAHLLVPSLPTMKLMGRIFGR